MAINFDQIRKLGDLSNQCYELAALWDMEIRKMPNRYGPHQIIDGPAGKAYVKNEPSFIALKETVSDLEKRLSTLEVLVTKMMLLTCDIEAVENPSEESER